ncbi:MAG: SRPBCC family protein [Pyrinomonadaceae bacterium]
MAEHILIRSLTLDLPRKEVFDFFADALNLERITPPELNFKITTPEPINIKQGSLIDYQLKLRGIPMKWQTEISVWNPPHSFTDKALKSPYKQWIHRHAFTELGENKTLIEDEVKYRLPLEPLGDLAHWFVRRELNYIFDFRQTTVADILGGGQRSAAGYGNRTKIV